MPSFRCPCLRYQNWSSCSVRRDRKKTSPRGASTRPSRQIASNTTTTKQIHKRAIARLPRTMHEGVRKATKLVAALPSKATQKTATPFSLKPARPATFSKAKATSSAPTSPASATNPMMSCSCTSSFPNTKSCPSTPLQRRNQRWPNLHRPARRRNSLCASPCACLRVSNNKSPLQHRHHAHQPPFLDAAGTRKSHDQTGNGRFARLLERRVGRRREEKLQAPTTNIQRSSNEKLQTLAGL